MNKQFVPVNEPNVIGGNEAKYVGECIETGWVGSEGKFVQQFEEKFSQLCGRKHGVAVSNGTVALEIAVRALKISEGSEVIVPTFCIISCTQAILNSKLKPIFVDCDSQTFNMIAENIETKITEKTRAIMVVHTYGLPCEMDKILRIAKKYNLLVIEDSAEVIGQTYNGKICGSFGDISTFSFYPNKHITTGEGGMIVCDDETLFERCKYLKNLCFEAPRRFVHQELGWNARITNLQAALGLAQLERIEAFVQKKREIGIKYSQAFECLKDKIDIPIEKTSYSDNIYWVYTIVLKDHVPFDAEEAQARLAKKGVGTRPFFWCMHEQPVLKKMGMIDGLQYPNSERIARRGFYIPSGLALTEQQQKQVIQAVLELFQNGSQSHEDHKNRKH